MKMMCNLNVHSMEHNLVILHAFTHIISNCGIVRKYVVECTQHKVISQLNTLHYQIQNCSGAFQPPIQWIPGLFLYG